MNTTDAAPMNSLDRALQAAGERGATQIYFLPNEPLSFRVRGKIERSQGPIITASDVRAIAIAAVGTERLKEVGRGVGRVTVACGLPGVIAGRLTLAQSLGDLTAVVQILHNRLPTPAQCRLPEALLRATRVRDGIVIFSGPTGSGKTSTLFSVVEDLNAQTDSHICTIEDPVSILLVPKRSIIQQREVGIDVPDIQTGITASLSQDPDILVITDLRNAEQVQAAVTAANTGRLVLTQVHANSPQEAIAKLIDVQPPEHAAAFRRELAQALRAASSQVLFPSAAGRGRVPAYGVLIVDDEMRRSISLGTSVLERASPLPEGCQSLENDIASLRTQGLIV